ncbi:MAG: flagellar assembly peptidoglycan hydrolase FlgJ [Caldimonas manganoxidans]|nr:flagellar assembly peptidoglycan hydrolase FlgJ [Caldimonas manganoxidans]
MNSPLTPLQGLSSDVQSLDRLRARAGQDPRAAVKEAARQFEAVFMQELLKSMRATTMASGLTDNAGAELGTELLDQQYANGLAGLPGGLADMIVRQLERHIGPPATSPGLAAPRPLPAALSAPRAVGPQGEFLREHWSAAQLAARETGIPEQFILAQAAHESGWGQREIRNADGSPSYNVFGIKATGGWKGKVAEVVTTEYVNGVPRKMVQKFRSYDSLHEAYRDYARLIKNNQRYARVIEQGQTAQGFAQGLQEAGYATDPAYADKLTRVINTTLRLQRAMS